MRTTSSTVAPSPIDSDFTRLSLRIDADRRDLSLDYWIDLPRDLAPRAVPANALALLLLPIAGHFHEDIVLVEPVDSLLLENLKGVQRIWRTWYPELTSVRILAPAAAPSEPATRQKQTLASFSGGIDSFFSLLRHQDRVTHLLSIAGFNTPIDDLDNMRRDLGPIAAKFGKRHVPVRTNIRYGNNPKTPYSIKELMCGLAHGCLLAAVAHLMEERFQTYIIPASYHYGRLVPYGSHPLSDPLFSSAGLRVVHDGAAFDRVERTEFMAQSKDALSVLHVCSQDFRLGNCSKCQKCLRTMATLDLVGARTRAGTFTWSNYSLDHVAAAWLPTENERAFFVEIADGARARGRLDLAQAAETAIVSSRRRARRCEASDARRLFVVGAIKSNRVTGSVWNALKAVRDRGLRRTLGADSPA